MYKSVRAGHSTRASARGSRLPERWKRKRVASDLGFDLVRASETEERVPKLGG
jgi:hypothetical protein